MWRGILAVIGVLACASCTYRSAVDMTPFEERSAFAQITPGTYCPVERDRDAPASGQVSTGVDDCGGISWDRAAREYRFVELAPAKEGAADVAGQDKDEPLAVVRLKPGLFLAQVRSGEPGDATPYEIILMLATRDALAPIDPLGNESLAALAQRHPKVTFRVVDARPEIMSGAREDIQKLLVDAAALSLKFYAESGERLSVLVRDPGTGPTRPLSGRQKRAIQAVDRLADGLVEHAPTGIERPGD
jgi:hypothetical protein